MFGIMLKILLVSLIYAFCQYAVKCRVVVATTHIMKTDASQFVKYTNHTYQPTLVKSQYFFVISLILFSFKISIHSQAD